jgi:hypothetical protein
MRMGRPKKQLIVRREEDGRYKKGKSGNPDGSFATLPLYHLRELKRRFTSLSIERIDTVTPAVVSKVIEMALDGNEAMLKFLWSHMVDKNYLNSVAGQLKSKTADDIDQSQEMIIDQMTKGEIDVEHGLMLLKGFAIKRDSSLVKVLEAEVNEIVESKR